MTYVCKVWLEFSDVAAEAKRIALEEHTTVVIRRLAVGWDIPAYPVWEAREDDDNDGTGDECVGAAIRTGLSPPEWEDGTPDEVDVSYGGAYVHSWDVD